MNLRTRNWRVFNISQDVCRVEFEIGADQKKPLLSFLEKWRGFDIGAELSKWVKKRSLDANALFWSCISSLSTELRTDKWEVYLMMLKRYGQFTYVCVAPKAVEAVRRQWRECEIIGDIEINGRQAVQLLCYYGSSTYCSKEFSCLIDGVISEMKELGLETPIPEDVKRSIEEWQKVHG